MPPEASTFPHPGLMGLCDLPVGATAAIVRMQDADHALLIRLKTMGMHEGRAVRMLRQGSRILVQCAGTRMGLAAEVARHVTVKPLAVCAQHPDRAGGDA